MSSAHLNYPGDVFGFIEDGRMPRPFDADAWPDIRHCWHGQLYSLKTVHHVGRPCEQTYADIFTAVFHIENGKMNLTR